MIKKGALPVFVARNTCRDCRSEVEYTRADVEGDQREGNYVRCPVCKALIAESTLKWKAKS